MMVARDLILSLLDWLFVRFASLISIWSSRHVLCASCAWLMSVCRASMNAVLCSSLGGSRRASGGVRLVLGVVVCCCSSVVVSIAALFDTSWVFGVCCSRCVSPFGELFMFVCWSRGFGVLVGVWLYVLIVLGVSCWLLLCVVSFVHCWVYWCIDAWCQMYSLS